MFAFCPGISQRKCGIPGTAELDGQFKLKAGLNESTVYADQLRYKNVDPSTEDWEKDYDSCFYEITLDESVLDEYIANNINLEITQKSDDMNVYIYKGRSRLDAKESAVAGNT